MADPINPRRSGRELLEQILRENPHLSRETVLAIAANAGFDLLDLEEPGRRHQDGLTGTTFATMGGGR